MLRGEQTITIVPEQTAHVAHAAFPKGNVYLWIRISRANVASCPQCDRHSRTRVATKLSAIRLVWVLRQSNRRLSFAQKEVRTIGTNLAILD